MDWLQFFAAIVGHIAWPVVAIAVLIVLRGRLSSWADRLIELTFPGGSVKFDKLLLKGAEIVESAPVPTLPRPADEPQLPLPAPPRESKTRAPIDLGTDIYPGNLDRLWTTSPSGQVLKAYAEIERLLDDLAQDLGWRGSPSKIMRYLVSEGKLGPEILELYKTLQAARNEVAHIRTMPSSNEVAEYVRQASYLALVLEALRAELKKGKENPAT